MKQIFIFRPKSKKTIWFFDLKIGDKSRIGICLKKLDEIYYEQKKAGGDILNNEFYSFLIKSISFFNNETARMKKIILKKAKSSVSYSGDCNEEFSISINSQLSALFYQLLHLFDELMCLLKTCADLGVFQKRSLSYKKIDHYKKIVKVIIHNTCQYKKIKNKVIYA